jgi:hypothetical protein
MSLPLALMVVTCSTPNETKPSCDTDESLCPMTPKTSTRVSCNCTCQLPHFPLADADVKYTGRVLSCLPPSLNPQTADPAAGLPEMSQGAYNQQVYKFCSEDVAQWLSLTIKSQVARLDQVPAGLACQPYECTCDMEGADSGDSSCETRCIDQDCDATNCESILRQGGILQLNTCACTRTTACGFETPAHDRPGLCRPPGNL